MLNSAIKEIREAEAKAQKIKSDAQLQAKTRIDSSQRAAKESLAELADVLDSVYKTRIAEATEQGEKEIGASLENSLSELSALRDKAYGNMQNTVDIIVGGILEQWQ